jgi:hypothetical protein
MYRYKLAQDKSDVCIYISKHMHTYIHIAVVQVLDSLMKTQIQTLHSLMKIERKKMGTLSSSLHIHTYIDTYIHHTYITFAHISIHIQTERKRMGTLSSSLPAYACTYKHVQHTHTHKYTCKHIKTNKTHTHTQEGFWRAKLAHENSDEENGRAAQQFVTMVENTLIMVTNSNKKPVGDTDTADLQQMQLLCVLVKFLTLMFRGEVYVHT